MAKNKYGNKSIYELSYTMRQERKRRFLNIAVFIIVFLAIMNIIIHFFVSTVRQQSVSMEPTIAKGSFSIATPIGLFTEKNKLQRGAIVRIERPQEKSVSLPKKSVDIVCRALTLQKFHPFSKNDSFLGRIAAIPGDTIYMKDFVLYITPSGEDFYYTEFELNQIPYSVDIRVPPADWNTQIGVRGNFDKTMLGKGEYFILCDNRLASMDSRVFGTVNESLIKQKVVMTYFPFKAFRIFRSKAKK